MLSKFGQITQMWYHFAFDVNVIIMGYGTFLLGSMSGKVVDGQIRRGGFLREDNRGVIAAAL